jgi:HEAT repeat protein
MIALLIAAFLVQDPVPTDKDAEAAVRRLKEECAKATIDGKIAAIQEAAKTEHEKVLKAIGDMMLSEADPVRIAAAAALGGADHPASADALAAAVLPNLRREEVLPAILKAIAELGWQTPAGRLNDLVSKVGDADVRAVLPTVIDTLGKLGSPSSIDPRMQSVAQ